MSISSSRMRRATSASSSMRASMKRSNAASSRARIGLGASEPNEIAVVSNRRPIMALEQAGGEQRHGMVAEIGGQIGKADACMRIALAAPERRRRIGILVRGEAPGAGELERRIGRARQQVERQRCSRPAGDRRGEPPAFALEIRPVADQHLGIQMHAPEIFVPGIERERPRIARPRLVWAPQIELHGAAIGERLGVVGPERDRAVVARERLLEALELVQRDAAIVEGLGQVRAQSERATAALQGFVVALEADQRIGAVVEGFGIVRLKRDRALVARQRVLETLELPERVAAVVEGLGEIGAQPRSPARSSPAPPRSASIRGARRRGW